MVVETVHRAILRLEHVLGNLVEPKHGNMEPGPHICIDYRIRILTEFAIEMDLNEMFQKVSQLVKGDGLTVPCYQLKQT